MSGNFEKIHVDLLEGSNTDTKEEVFVSRTSFIVGMDTKGDEDEAEVMKALFDLLENRFPTRKVSVGHRTFPVLRAANRDNWMKD